MRRLAGIAAGDDSLYRRSDVFTTDRRVSEKSRSAYAQYSTTFDWRMPLHVAAGVRYERTQVESTALVPTYSSIVWGSANELNLVQRNRLQHAEGRLRLLVAEPRSEPGYRR